MWKKDRINKHESGWSRKKTREGRKVGSLSLESDIVSKFREIDRERILRPKLGCRRKLVRSPE